MNTTTITYNNKTYTLMTDSLIPYWINAEGEKVNGDYQAVLAWQWLFGN